VETYLYTSADSIIATEIERPSKDSKAAPAVYVFLASRAQLDLSTMTSKPHDNVSEPKGMVKVSIDVVSKDNLVKQWVSDPRSGAEAETITVNGIRVLTKDQQQADEVMAKLRSGK
jgi:hypothetical protein